MSLHDSPFAIKESEEVQELQDRLKFMQDIINSCEDNTEVDMEFTIDFLHTLYALLDKQLIITTRLRLSDDIIDKDILNQMNESAQGEGLVEDVDLHHYLLRRRRAVRQQIIELTGEDLDEPVNLS